MDNEFSDFTLIPDTIDDNVWNSSNIKFSNGMREFMYIVIGMIIVFATIVTLAYCKNVRRIYPMNLILLGLLTLGNGICVGWLSSQFDYELVNVIFGSHYFYAEFFLNFFFQS